MTSDRAEAIGFETAEVERAEAAHRDPADRDPVPVGAAARERRRDCLAEHV
jgi:hypothetical protein